MRVESGVLSSGWEVRKRLLSVISLVHPTQRERRGQEGAKGIFEEGEKKGRVRKKGGAEGKDPPRPEVAGGYRTAQTRSGWEPMRETRRERALVRGMSRVLFVERRRMRRTVFREVEPSRKRPRIWIRSSL